MISDIVAAEIQTRAQERCEYCKMHDSLQGATYHLEHVRPRSQGGTDEIGNLAWACPNCNLQKSNRTIAQDPETSAIVPLFNPRVHLWREHFEFRGTELQGLSAIGRAAISILTLNHPRRRRIRQVEAMCGLFPP